MFQDDDCVETLMGLGLTLLQAKIYLGLAKLGVADVKSISKVSKVARQDVYRVTPKLQKRGLAEKIISTPTLYRAIPLKKGLSALLQQKVEENAEMKEKTSKLIAAFDDNFSVGMTIKENLAEFIITSEKTLFRKRITESTLAAQKSKDSILNTEGFNSMLFNGKQDLKSALKKGVKVRVIAEKPENPQAIEGMITDLEHSLLNIKYIPPPAPICLMIFDDKEVHLRMSEGAVPSFWSNNPNIVSLSRRYFNELWNQI